MKEENRKEILTNENIEYDIDKTYIYKIKSITMGLIVCLIASFVSCLTIKTNDIVPMITVTLVVLITVMIFICWCVLLLKYVNKNYKYTIERDCFIGTGVHRVVTQRMSCMEFKTYGKFVLQNEMTYYAWSKVNQMNNKTLKKTSLLNDEFYLILINGKIINAYNTKFFEIQ